ncbi:MAG: transposase, partial [Methylocella sp.]
MSRLVLLGARQRARISPYFLLSRGAPRVAGRRVVGGIVYVIRNGLQGKDAPRGSGPRKPLYDRFVRGRRRGVFDRIFAARAGGGPKPERAMIDAAHLKARRT